MCNHETEQKIQSYRDFSSIDNSRVKKSWLKEGYSNFKEQSWVVKEGGIRNKKLEVWGNRQ